MEQILRNLTEVTTASTVPRVSIGVPTYNRPDELAQCLRELSAQTFEDLEIIVADNASDDSRVTDVLDRARRDDPRIRVMRHASNIGPIHNFQFVFEQARGEYFCWAADDDQRNPEFIAEMVNCLDANPESGLAFCEFEEFPRAADDAEKRALQLRRVLEVMTRKARWLRLLGFFLAPEGLSKPHPIYGLIRRAPLANFSMPNFLDRNGWHGGDSLFVFHILVRGPLTLCKRTMIRFRLDGVKYHALATTSPHRLWAQLIGVSRLCSYASRYARIAPTSVATVILLLLPLKWAEILYVHLLRPAVGAIVRRLYRDASDGRRAP